MANRGPLVTLLVVLGFAAALLVAASVNAAGAPTPAASPAASPAPAGGPSPAPGGAASGPTSRGAPPGRSIFAGRSSGDEVTVAVAVDNGTAVAYVCDGHRVESWLRGRVDGDRVRLTGAGGVELTGNVTPRAMLGTIRGAGHEELAFSANAAQPPAGVYRSRTTINGLDARFGWAILPDGSETGVGDVAGAVGPAPWMDPASGAFDAGGAPATATPVAGSDAVGGP